jgi:multiple sugar transport system permease protein
MAATSGSKPLTPDWSRKERRNLLVGLAFISPWLIGFALFTIYPLISSFYFSLTRYDLIREPVFIGLNNYIFTFTKDPRFWTVLGNTIYYVVFSVPLSIITAFLIANLLNTNVVGRSVFRGIIYIPSIVPAVCTAMVWLLLLNIQYGAINGMLQSLGLQAIPFLSNPSISKPTLIMIAAWACGGTVVIFLASLQDVPRSLYEAATVDGANAWQRFLNVTIPLSSPVILFNLIIGFIGSFQEFTLPWLLTNGGPAASTEFYSLHLYRTAFQNLRMGTASALAWILFVIIVVFTVLLFRSSGRWVYYGGER